MTREKCAAIVLAAGKGSRMKSDVAKQYLLLKRRPMLYYSLAVFQNSPIIDEILLVTGEGETDYCQEEIVNRYNFTKVGKIITGGRERYHSVHRGLEALSACRYVFIHDGARPFVDSSIIERAYEAVKKHQACVVGMPVKDTIKIADEEQFAAGTPDRNTLWQIQTPQVFDYQLIREAYDCLMSQNNQNGITDDAMVVERTLGRKVKLVQGSYRNIKVTTPEDLIIAESFCQNLS